VNLIKPLFSNFKDASKIYNIFDGLESVPLLVNDGLESVPLLVNVSAGGFFILALKNYF